LLAETTGLSAKDTANKANSHIIAIRTRQHGQWEVTKATSKQIM